MITVSQTITFTHKYSGTVPELVRETIAMHWAVGVGIEQ